MRGSRKFVSILLGLTALFCIGAVVGSYWTNIPVYAAIAAVCVALVLFGLWFYYGHEKVDDTEDSSEESDK